MLLTSLICLSVFAFSPGTYSLWLPHVRRDIRQGRDVSLSTASSSAYLLEAAGSALGGILASVVLLRFLESFQIAVVAALVTYAWLQFVVRRGSQTNLGGCSGWICLAVLFLLMLRQLWTGFRRRAVAGFHLLESRNSIYGNLAVIETGSIRSIYDNGVILANVPTRLPPKKRFTTRCWSILRRGRFCLSAAARTAASFRF